MIRLKSLQRICGQLNSETDCLYADKCTHCGLDVNIMIDKTSGGYGLRGGALFEPGPMRIVALCVDCYEKLSTPEPGSLKKYENTAMANRAVKKYDRRRGIEKRRTRYAIHIPERRTCNDRRVKSDRRISGTRRNMIRVPDFRLDWDAVY